MPLIDSAIHLEPGWGKHIPSDGSHIDSGPDPDVAEMVQGSPTDEDALFLLKGPAACAAEWFISRPLQQGNPQLDLEFVVGPEPFYLFETDLLIIANGWKTNLSLQNWKGGIQIAKSAGGWVDTGFKPGIPAPGILHRLTVNYKLGDKVGSTTSIAVDGEDFEVPVALQNVAAIDTTAGGKQAGWKDGAMLQIQRKLAVAGTAVWSISRMDLTWV